LTKDKLRITSLIMLIIAVIFVFCAMSNPGLGRVFYIFGIPIGVEVWRAFYKLYAIVMILLFASSFFVKNGKVNK